MQVDDHLAPGFVRREHDLFDHRADQLGGLAASIRAIQRGDQPLHRVMKPARHVRVNEDRRFILGVGRQFQRTLVRLKGVDLVLEKRGVDPLLERVQELLDLSLGARDLVANRLLGDALLPAQAVDRIRVFAAENFAGFRLHEAAAQPTQHYALEFVFGNRESILANPLIARAGASVLRRGHLRHAASALAAFDEEREQFLPAQTASAAVLPIELGLIGF